MPARNPTSPPKGDDRNTDNQQIPDSKIKIDPFANNDLRTVYLNQGDDLTFYTDYRVRNRYEKDLHIYMMPITSPTGFMDQSVSFVQLATPTVIWIADWTASRFNFPPDIPSPDFIGVLRTGGTVPFNDWFVLDIHIELPNVVVAGDGRTPLYRITGTYVFGNRKPSASLSAMIKFPRRSDFDDVLPRVVPANNFKNNIIN